MLPQGDCPDELARLWKAFDDFGRHEATWIPYWENGKDVLLAGGRLVVPLQSLGFVVVRAGEPK